MSETLEVKIGASDVGLQATLKTVQAELARLDTKIKDGDLSFKELESTMKRIGQVTMLEKNIKAIGNASADTLPKVRGLGDSVESAGDKTKKAGGIFDDEFKRMGAAFTVGNLAADGFQKAISLAFDAARAVVQGFSDALDLGGRLNDLSVRTGVAAGTLLVLETAFKNSGLEASQVGVAINKLQNFMQDAANGGDKQIQTMNQLGISLSDLAGKTPTDQMRIFADKIAGIQDPTQRAATASDVFGDKLGGKLLPLLVGFSGNLDDARGKVGSLEQVMNDNAAAFDKFSESIDTIKGKMTAFSAGILSETVPSLQELGTSMAGVDAAGFGKIIGQILNPAIIDLTKNIFIATDIFGILKKSASDAASGLQDNSDGFKQGATEANKYLQVLAALLPGGLDPLGLGLKAVASVSNDATKGMNDVATAANDAKPSLSAMGNQAVDTGTKINTAFTLTSDLKPELDSIGNGWGDISDKIQTSNSLLDGTGAAFVAISQSTQDQVAGIGGVNDQLTVSQDLNKLILALTGEIADKEADAAALTAQKAADQQIQNKLKQDELQYQLDLATAQAAGDSARVQALQDSKKYADDLKKALDAGLDPTQAALFADNMAIAANNSRNIKYLDANGNPLFFDSAKAAADLSKSLASATGFADTLSKMNKIKALEDANNTAKAAKDELKAMDKLLGTDLAQKSFPDIVKKLNIDKLGQTGQDQIDAVVKYMNQVKTNLTNNPIDTASGQQSIKDLVNFLNGNPLNSKLLVDYQTAKSQTTAAFSNVSTKLDAQKSVNDLRDSVKSGLEIDVAAKSGVNGTLDLIKTAVEAIKTLVGKIEPKLPVAALI